MSMDAQRIVKGFEEAGYPIAVEQRADGKWEVTVNVGGTPTTLFASATTREAAIEHAAQTIFPAILVYAIGTWLGNRKASAKPFLNLDGPALLAGSTVAAPMTVRRTAADEFGGFGFMVRFKREPDDSYSWGVFDEQTGDGLCAGTVDDFENAKLEALMNLLPPNVLEQ